MGALQSPCKSPIERGFVKPLYIKGFAMGALLSLQSSYREGPMPHTYAHFSLFYKYGGVSLEGLCKAPIERDFAI